MTCIKHPKVVCHDCIYPKGYWPMYVGNDRRRWGTCICTRTMRYKRVNMLSDFAGCNKGVKREEAKK